MEPNPTRPTKEKTTSPADSGPWWGVPRQPRGRLARKGPGRGGNTGCRQNNQLSEPLAVKSSLLPSSGISQASQRIHLPS